MRTAILFSTASGIILATESVIQESTLVPVSLLIVLLSGIAWIVWQAARTLDRIENRLVNGDKRFDQIEKKINGLPCMKEPVCREREQE